MAMEAMEIGHVHVPVNYDAIHEAQADDKELLELRNTNKTSSKRSLESLSSG